MSLLDKSIYHDVLKEDCILTDLCVKYNHFGKKSIVESINYLIEHGYVEFYLDSSSFGIDVKLKIVS